MTEKTRHNGITILAVSDFTDAALVRMVEEKQLNHVDLIISCGDLEPEYLSFLRNRLEKPLFYVKGNHDIRYSEEKLIGCQDIHARLIRFKALKIMGLEGSLWYNGNINQYTDRQMDRIIFSMWVALWRKGGVDMVVAHAPPRHIHDAEDRCHMGFDSFVKLIHKRKPSWFIHGHIHKEFQSLEERTTVVGSTKVINICGFTLLEV